MSGKRSRPMRTDGPETDSAATTAPSGPRTGAATATRPGSSSESATAQPRSRTTASSRSSRARAPMVRDVRRSSRPCGSGAPAARKTLPRAVQCSGTRVPTQFTLPIRKVESTCAICSTSCPTMTARLIVSPVASLSASSRGAASAISWS